MPLFIRNTRILMCYAVRKFKRPYGSALFIPGHKATDVCASVTPHIDIQDRFQDMNALKENIKRRNRDIDIKGVKEVWDFYGSLLKNKEKLEAKRSEISNVMKELIEVNSKEALEQMEKLKIHAKIIKEDVKNLKTSLWSLEESAVLYALALPNVLHAKTPDNEEVIYSYKDKPVVDKVRSHIDLSVEAGYLKFNSPNSYYLKNDAACFELSAKFYFSKVMRDAGRIQFSNPDFTKSVVVEGCGLNHTDPDSVFILHHNEDTKVNEDIRLHLTGGGSLLAFAAYYTRNLLFPTAFPLKYFSLGRQYNPVPSESNLGLFRVSQAAVAEVFSAVKDCNEELNKELDSIVELIKNTYKNIGYHFTMSYLPAFKLNDWESLRISIKMFSPYLNEYIEVGHVSVSDNFISKRLQFSYKQDGVAKFPKIISGTVLNVPKLFGCAVEQDPNVAFKIPLVIKNSLF